MEEHDDEATVDVTGSPVSAEGDHGAYGEASAGSEADAYSDERAAETSRRLLRFGLRRGLSRGLVAKPPGGEGECAVKRVITFAQAVHGAVKLLFERGARPRAQQPDHGVRPGSRPLHHLRPFVHIAGANADKQLRHVDIARTPPSRACSVEHPRLAEQGVVCRRTRATDGEPLEPLEEHLLRGRR